MIRVSGSRRLPVPPASRTPFKACDRRNASSPEAYWGDAAGVQAPWTASTASASAGHAGDGGRHGEHRRGDERRGKQLTVESGRVEKRQRLVLSVASAWAGGPRRRGDVPNPRLAIAGQETAAGLKCHRLTGTVGGGRVVQSGWKWPAALAWQGISCESGAKGAYERHPRGSQDNTDLAINVSWVSMPLGLRNTLS